MEASAPGRRVRLPSHSLAILEQRMSHTTLLLLIAVLAVATYWYGKQRALALVGGRRGIRQLHSLPSYYGWLTALTCALPCVLVVALWAGFQDSVITSMVQARVGAAVASMDATQLGLFMNDVRNVMSGAVPADQASEAARQGAAAYTQLRGVAGNALAGLLLALAAIGLFL